MDRNEGKLDADLLIMVALRKESVDRNMTFRHCTTYLNVALRKESVDRNSVSILIDTQNLRSLSARRAWIEILL